MVLDPETVRRFFSGMHDVEVVIRCYFNNNFILVIMILSGTAHFVCLFV